MKLLIAVLLSTSCIMAMDDLPKDTTKPKHTFTLTTEEQDSLAEFMEGYEKRKLKAQDSLKVTRQRQYRDNMNAFMSYMRTQKIEEMYEMLKRRK